MHIAAIGYIGIMLVSFVSHEPAVKPTLRQQLINRKLRGLTDDSGTAGAVEQTSQSAVSKCGNEFT